MQRRRTISPDVEAAAWIASDGSALVDPNDLFVDADPQKLTDWLGTRLDQDGRLSIAYNPLLLRIAGRTVLVDAGNGRSEADSLADLGRLIESLRELGARPTDIDVVLITHAHGDHIGGLTYAKAGRRVPTFPHARHVISQREWTFWVEETHSDAVIVELAEPARTHLPILWDSGVLELATAPCEVLPGVTARSAPGHTPGHLAFLADLRSESLLITGDVIIDEVHARAPTWAGAVDRSPAEAAHTRIELLTEAATFGHVVHGYHVRAFARATREQGGGYRLELLEHETLPGPSDTIDP